MMRSLIAGVIATAIGLGISAQASAQERYRDGRNYGDHHGWNNGNHHGWNRGHHYGWDRNRDGRADWRDRRYDHRDVNRDGRVDWRDRRQQPPMFNFPSFFGR